MDSLEEQFVAAGSSRLVRASGRLLLWTIAAVVCYAAAHMVS